MTSVLVIGGTRFIGRHIVTELFKYDYTITLLTRGNQPNPFVEEEGVYHITGDRTDESTIKEAAEKVEPDIVIDSVAFYPADVRTATRIFSDIDTYIYISSVGAYDSDHLLKHESRTPLVPCSKEEATDDSFETYEARKAEGDRIALSAAEDGVPAMVVRPTMVYGPHNHLGFVKYWIDRVANDDRILVPGNGDYISHRTYVGDIASAIRILIEKGEHGEAYNIGDQRPLTVNQLIELISDVTDTTIDPVYTNPEELAREGLSVNDFPLYMGNPFVMSTEKLSSLGWESTPVEEAMEQTVEYHQQHDLQDYEVGPSREDENRLLNSRL